MSHDVIALARIARRAGANKLDGLRFTPPQRAFLEDPAPIALWRDGNQLGKARPWQRT